MKEQLLVDNFSVESSGKQLLREVSFAIKRGTWLSVVGPNGAGKSTLLKSLAGIIKQRAGACWLGSTRIDSLSQRERACYLSYVPQQFEALVPFSVDQFLTLALYAESSINGAQKVRSAYELFRLDNFKERSIQKLSTGEMQRVLLAAAFVQGSDLLLLDEPSSALDPFEESEILTVLCRLKNESNKTIIFVSHNLSSALSLADSVLVLREGSNIFFGSSSELVDQRLLDSTFCQSFRIITEGRQYSVIQKLPNRHMESSE